MFKLIHFVACILFIMSFGFLVSALPTTALNSKELAVRHDSSELATLVVNLQADIDVCAKAIGEFILPLSPIKPNIDTAGLSVTADIFAQIDILTGKINSCAAAILALGAGIDIEASVKADIAAKLGAIISVIVQLCISLNAKLGIIVVLGLFAKIDACLQLLITNSGVCAEGIISLVANVVVKFGIEAFANTHLGLCAQVLGLTGA
ncbi:hypothetical protein RHS01_03666 [Rhizoctonia solani]|uniref:Transmembrane protein n=1 Tax=Rhizoctonia solani TaxID=456999 RepID=A0A8H7IJA5_9AGAM|nr:hypothetical protein RHS01_03666 [Rhizoctonia solani]